jgi:hypothetical protein
VLIPRISSAFRAGAVGLERPLLGSFLTKNTDLGVVF